MAGQVARFAGILLTISKGVFVANLEVTQRTKELAQLFDGVP